ncbi:MAG: nitrogen fixation protein NifZ [Beijerinckiaceae bacterium]
MIESTSPKYQWGQRIRTVQDLFNDGSYPDRPADALLAPEGTVGEIVQVGLYEESNTPVYLVEFAPKCVVGCVESEIAPL